MKCLIALLLLFASTTAAVAVSPTPPPEATAVAAGGLVGNLFVPAGRQGRLPGVIVLGGSEGGLSPAVSHEAQLIAVHGYVALQLAYFGAADLPDMLQLVPVEYFEAAIAWLRQRPDVDPGHIAIVGTSIGGEAALLVAAHDPAISAVAAAVPSDVVWQGISDGIDQQAISSFTIGGRALPDLPFGWGGVTHDVYQSYAGGLRALPRHPDAIIPVERIHGPVLLICGKRDRVWPSCPMAAAVAARLTARNFPHPVQFLSFPRAGHAVFGAPVDPASEDYADLGSLGGSAAANAAARRSAWTAFLAFLDRALRPGHTAEPVRLSRPLAPDE
jgi:uncharacterized protein